MIWLLGTKSKMGKMPRTSIRFSSSFYEFEFGTVLYLRMVNLMGAYCLFPMGKSHLAHIKLITVLRLKFSAVVLVVQLHKTLKSELEILVPLQQSVLWIGSTTVLRYIRNDTARFLLFVSNRLAIIHEHSDPSLSSLLDSEAILQVEEGEKILPSVVMPSSR